MAPIECRGPDVAAAFGLAPVLPSTPEPKAAEPIPKRYVTLAILRAAVVAFADSQNGNSAEGVRHRLFLMESRAVCPACHRGWRNALPRTLADRAPLAFGRFPTRGYCVSLSPCLCDFVASV